MAENNDHDLLIALNTKIDNILERLSSVDGLEKRVRDLEIARGKETESMETQRSEIEKLRTVNSIWSATNTIGGIILAAFIGWINR